MSNFTIIKDHIINIDHIDMIIIRSNNIQINHIQNSIIVLNGEYEQIELFLSNFLVMTWMEYHPYSNIGNYEEIKISIPKESILYLDRRDKYTILKRTNNKTYHIKEDIEYLKRFF